MDTENYKICVAAIVENKGQVLVGRPTESKVFVTNGWHLPGGKLQENEVGEEAIIREMQEEAGIGVKVNKFLGEKIISKRKTKVKWYLCSTLANDLKVGGDLIEAKFVPKSEVVKICDPEAIASWPSKVIEYFNEIN